MTTGSFYGRPPCPVSTALMSSMTHSLMWQALRNFRALRISVGVLSVAFLGAAITNASITAGRSLAPVWLAAAAAVLGAVAAAAHNYAQRLVLARYHHYEHN